MFRPEHDAFWLYPTAVHQQQQGLLPDEDDRRRDLGPEPTEDAVPIGTLAVVTSMARIHHPSQLDALRGFHRWTDETIHARFRYRTPGLWLLVVRSYNLETIRILPVRTGDRGCHTWVPLAEAIPTAGVTPVLPDDEHARGSEAIARALDATRTEVVEP